MLDCWETGRGLRNWISFGGAATLRSYGFADSELNMSDEQIIKRMHDLIPERDIRFMQNLRPSLFLAGHFFAHAGVKPGVPLDQQSEEDLVWIREKFLEDRRHHGALVVHGHSIVRHPDVKANRIAIDTGCFRTGSLTALVIEGTEKRFLRTGPDAARLYF